MRHFTCDLCGQPVVTERYVAKVEVHPAFDPEEIQEVDLDIDHLQEISEALAAAEETGEDPICNDSEPKTFEFDLCPNCHKRYIRDPLGREALRRLTFSEN